MKRSRARRVLLVASGAIAVAVVLGTVAAQQSGEAAIRKAFAAADANADGAMDVNEFVANTIYLFKEMARIATHIFRCRSGQSTNPAMPRAASC